jgi:hypothetical protein
VKTINKVCLLMFAVFLLLTSSWGEASPRKEASPKAQPAHGNPPRPLAQQRDGHWSANEPATTAEGYDIHAVKRGDTLWEISRQYLKDPFLWPQIWEVNSNVDNPHWIYPGDHILIKRIAVMTQPPSESLAPTASGEPSSQTPPQRRSAAIPASTETPDQSVPTAPATPSAPPPVATYTDLYCAGFFSPESIQSRASVVGGEESENKSLFSDRDVLYLNQGSASGIKPGDELQVIRPVTDFAKWGTEFAKAKSKERYGHYYQDVGRLRVLLAQENSATVEVIFACEEIHVNDLTIPAEQRLSPLQRGGSFDRFAPPSGKTTGRVFMSKEFRSLLSSGNIVYVDVGSKQNVQVGDYFRVLRHFHKDSVSLFNRADYNRNRATFDSTRKVIGEVVILRVEPNASTALITYSNQDIWLGDGVELE